MDPVVSIGSGTPAGHSNIPTASPSWASRSPSHRSAPTASRHRSRSRPWDGRARRPRLRPHRAPAARRASRSSPSPSSKAVTRRAASASTCTPRIWMTPGSRCWCGSTAAATSRAPPRASGTTDATSLVTAWWWCRSATAWASRGSAWSTAPRRTGGCSTGWPGSSGCRRTSRAFGGDPHRVTVGGQSAGGGACATLATVPTRSRVCSTGCWP